MLLFQYREDLGNGKSDVMRCCEERLIVLQARNAESALRKAKAHGKKAEFKGKSSADNPLLFEFVGVKDLLELHFLDENEVWYDIRTLKLPMERRSTLIPPEEELNAIFWERRNKKR
jgi:hypothetical protein